MQATVAEQYMNLDRGHSSAANVIPSLDGIRAVSFLIVFLSHAYLGNIVPGAFGVTVFFFLSGYLITTLLRLEYDNSGRVSFRDFYLRRALRILPPFYTVLILAVILTWLGVSPGSLRIDALVAVFAHVANYWIIFRGYSGMPAGTGAYWSLAVEEHFYLVFPLVYVLLQRVLARQRFRQALFLLVCCVAVLIWRILLVSRGHVGEYRTYLATDTRIDSILFGCALAVGGNPILDRLPGSPSLWRWLFLPLGVFLLFVTFVYHDESFRETFLYSLQGIGLIPIFVVAIREPGWGVFRLLNLPLVRQIGVLSYSLYLVHHVMLFLFEKQFPNISPVAWACGALVASILVALAIHALIEKPCGQLRKRLAHVKWRMASNRPG